MPEGEAKGLLKEDVFFDCYVFCMFLYTSLQGDILSSSCIHFRHLSMKEVHLKELIT